MFRVFTLTHFLAKPIFSRGYGGIHNCGGNSGGVGGYFCGQKMGIPWRRGWGLREIPFVVGVWIFSGTAQYVKTYSKSCNTCTGVPIDFKDFLDTSYAIFGCFTFLVSFLVIGKL